MTHAASLRALLGATLLCAAAFAAAQDAVPQLGPAPRADPSQPQAAPPSAVLVEPGEAAATVPAIDTSNRAAVAAAYSAYWNVAMPSLNWTGSVAGCQPGTVSMGFLEWMMTRINFARAMAGLPGSTTLDVGLSAPQQQATSLLMYANGTITHSPSPGMTCYSSAAAAGAGSSNLAYGSMDAVSLYMDDLGNPDAGHRRWILDSKKNTFAIGQVGTYNAMYVFDMSATRQVPNGIPWPPRGYVPLDLMPGLESNEQYWSFGYPGGDFSAATVTLTRNGAPVPVTVVSRNANGYGDNTIVWRLPADHRVTAESTYQVTINNVINASSSTFTYQVRPFDPSGTGSVRGDLNGDRRSDILYRNLATGQVYRMLMDDFAVMNDAIVYHEPNLAWSIVNQGDFNGDGTTDLLWRHASNGQVYVQLFSLEGRPSGGGVVWTEPNAAWRIAQVTDLNGDRRSDLLWWNSTTGQVYAMIMNGASVTAHGMVFQEPDTSWRIVAAGDLTGGGVPNHVVWWNAATGHVYFQTLNFNGSSFGTSGLVVYREPNTAWKILAAVDLDADGRADLVWRNESTGEVYGMLMDGNAVKARGMIHREPNLAWKVVAQGDYDGDARHDLLWRNEETGEVVMMLMNGLGVAALGTVYREPNTAWRILGPWEYGR